MVKDIKINSAIVSKAQKSWGKHGIVEKVYGTSRSVKFDVKWADGSTSSGISTRGICLPQNLPPKSTGQSNKRKLSAVLTPTPASEDGENESSGDDGSNSSASEISNETDVSEIGSEKFLFNFFLDFS